MDIEDFFTGYESARPLYEAVRRIIDGHEAVEQHISKSQIVFRRRIGFAWVWIPGRYLREPVAPLVLSVALRRRDSSQRWKEIVEPKPGRFMHHLELRSVVDVDAEVRDWIHEAWSLAV